MNKTGTIIATLHRVSGNTTPESYDQPPYQHPFSYTPYQEQSIEEKSSLEKSFEVFLESTRQIQISTNSSIPQNFQIQNSYSIFQVPPQQEE